MRRWFPVRERELQEKKVTENSERKREKLFVRRSEKRDGTVKEKEKK